MLATLALASGTLSTGYLLYKRWFNEQSKAWLVEKRDRWIKAPFMHIETNYSEMDEDSITDEFDLEQQIAISNRGLRNASISLGLATIGALVYTPISVMVIPALVYLGIPSARNASKRLLQERTLTISLLETGVIVLCIVQGYYFIGSLGFCVYYLVRRLFYKTQHEKQMDLVAWKVPSSVQLKSEENVEEVLTSQVQSGDTIVVQAGEMVPMDGIITSGSAWINRRHSTAQENPIIQTVGSRVTATDIVLVGQINIEISLKAE